MNKDILYEYSKDKLAWQEAEYIVLCMCTCEGVCICVQVPLCGNQRSMLDVFLSYCSSYDLRQDLSLNLEPSDSVKLDGQELQGSVLPFLQRWDYASELLYSQFY